MPVIVDKKAKLQECIEQAKSRGGECLSTEYVGSQTKMLWKCNKDNHPQWEAHATMVVGKGKTWCAKCAQEESAQKNKLSNALELAQNHAKSLGGQCLSKDYIRASHKMLWQCSSNHNWEATYSQIMGKKKNWCPECSRQKRLKYTNLTAAIEHAKKMGGKCLSVEYKNTSEKLMWHCGNSVHKNWLASFESIIGKHKSWCPECANEKRGKFHLLKNGLYEAQQYAISRGGECLSTKYINAKSPMKWKCGAGHIWESDKDHLVNRKRWCKECFSHVENAYDIIQNYAKSKGGYAIVPKGKINSSVYIEYKCSDPSHKTWKSTYRNSVKNGSWCPYCNGNFSPQEYLEKAGQYASSKSGTCLSTEYHGQRTKLTFKCNKKHHKPWSIPYAKIVAANSWCSECAYDSEQPQRDAYLKKAKDHALSIGGECLSTQYHNSKKKLLWQCEKKHKPWAASFSNVVGTLKRWCPECAGLLSPEQWLDKANKHAQSLGGEFLSKNYTNCSDKYEWRCSNSSHKTWFAALSNIFNGKTWCPECSSCLQSENQCRALLEYLFGIDLKKTKPDWNINPKTNKRLELDGYNEKNMIAFEYQGKHHYVPNVYSTDGETLEYIQFKDKIKAEHCVKRGITLLIIDGRKRFYNASSMLNALKKELDCKKVSYRNNIDLTQIEKIYKTAKNLSKNN